MPCRSLGKAATRATAFFRSLARAFHLVSSEVPGDVAGRVQWGAERRRAAMKGVAMFNMNPRVTDSPLDAPRDFKEYCRQAQEFALSYKL